MLKLITSAVILAAILSTAACHAAPSPGDAWVYEHPNGKAYTNVVDRVQYGFVVFHNPDLPEHFDCVTREAFEKYCTRRAGEPKAITGSDGLKYTVVAIDGCEYFKGVAAGGPVLCHKGNCSNKAHGSAWNSNIFTVDSSPVYITNFTR